MMGNAKVPNVENIGEVGEQGIALTGMKDIQCRASEWEEASLNEIINTGREVTSVTKRFTSWLDTLLY